MINTNTIIKFFGICFIFLGYWRITRFIELSTIFMFSFSLAGFLFILYDWSNFHIENAKKKKIKKCKMIFLIRCRDLCLLLCVFSMIALPHLPIHWSQETLVMLNDAIVLLGLGIVVFLIGLKSDKELDTAIDMLEDLGQRITVISDKYEKIIIQRDNEIRNLKEEIEKGDKSNTELE